MRIRRDCDVDQGSFEVVGLRVLRRKRSRYDSVVCTSVVKNTSGASNVFPSFVVPEREERM